MMAPTASGRAQYCRFVHAETAPAKPMHNKGSDETNSEGFSAHPELSRRSAAHVRRHHASSGRLCEVLDRILAVVPTHLAARRTPTGGFRLGWVSAPRAGAEHTFGPRLCR